MRTPIASDAGWMDSGANVRPHTVTGGRLVSLLRRLDAMLLAARQRRDLLELDDRTLMDIGVTRADVWREANRRFWDIDF
ncbi:MAG: DUF1127 domain-containing protein [Hyphomicrobiaceae bacterium]